MKIILNKMFSSNVSLSNKHKLRDQIILEATNQVQIPVNFLTMLFIFNYFFFRGGGFGPFELNVDRIRCINIVMNRESVELLYNRCTEFRPTL